MESVFMFDRRNIMKLGLGTGAAYLSGCQGQNTPVIEFGNLSQDQAFKTYIKSIGTLDTSDIYVWFKGVLWGVLPSSLPTPLCGFQGLARHKWTANSNGTFIQKAYDVGFFSDLQTNKPINFMINPLTGEKVEIYNNKYGGYVQTHNLDSFTDKTNGKMSKHDQLDWSEAGNQLILTERSIGQVTSKIQPDNWPRETSGPLNFYGGETSYAMSRKQVEDPSIKTADYALFWSSFSPWEPWLLMDGALGTCQWRATGVKLRHYSEAPREMLNFVAKDQPNYFDEGDPWEGYRSSIDSYIKDRGPVPRSTR